MRIALLTYRGNMFCGGQGIYAAYIARELTALGHQVHVIAGPPLPELEPGIPLHVIPNRNFFARELDEVLAEGRPFEALWPSHLWELGLTRLGVFPEMTAFGLRLLVRWRRLQRRYRFDVVLDNQSLSWGLLGLQATGVPVAAMVHHPLHIDREADFALDPRFRRKWKRTLYFPMFMQQRVVPRLAQILTVSQASADEITRYFGVPRKQIAVVYNGTDTHMFRPLQREKETDLIFVGRTEDRKKGISNLLDALAHTPSAITLKIVDGRIPKDGLVPRKIRELGLARRIKLVERMLSVEELVAEYSTARIAVVPSYFEGFGFPASEAMACGLPVVASDGGALPEVVGSAGEAGRLVRARDVDALARALEELALQPELAAELGRAARRRIQRVFTWREAGRRTAELLEEVVRAHRRP
ncbi:MAG: glycosyltransferase family 1 protein [Deltaproteobacteria bacterium]|nr:MAG: glycosyltransferase family 1 protein [Deltaproteobacteria bacterium]